jgi:SHS family lactate transporter-like MFS transporter
VLPLWAFSATPLLLGLGGFLMQLSVQGAWGVIPVHLNELSPDSARAVFPGAAYQFGNLLASVNAYWQGSIAFAHKDAAGKDNYGLALALVAGTVAVVIAVLRRRGLGQEVRILLMAPDEGGCVRAGRDHHQAAFAYDVQQPLH